MSNATYNLTRFTRQVLKRHRRAPASLVIHLYPTHFRFDGQVRFLFLFSCPSYKKASLIHLVE
jgi:hypothetical protein